MSRQEVWYNQKRDLLLIVSPHWDVCGCCYSGLRIYFEDIDGFWTHFTCQTHEQLPKHIVKVGAL